MDDITAWSERAFELAYFIHRDRSVACRVVIEAMDQLDTVAQMQTKRSYYRAIGRRGRPPYRDKISLPRAPLLQHLICLESERRDLTETRGAGPGRGWNDADHVIRFLVFLACITVARNAFYASVGIGRLLYRYTTDEIIQIYDVLIQDPERYRGADAIRAGKKKLMNDILNRFGPTIRVRRAPRGEKVLDSRPAREVPTDLVFDTLRLLTPWGTECSLGSTFEPLLDELPGFRFTDSNPDREHDYEMRRIHTLFHPACFEQLVVALGFTAPEQNLMLPIFFTDRSDKHDEDDPGQRFTAPLSLEERQTIEDEVATRARRRACWKPGRLSVYADGTRRLGTIDGSRGGRRSFRIPSTVRTLDVRGEHPDGPIRLAVFLMIGEESTAEPRPPRVVRLAEGQEISFRPRPADGGLGGDHDDSYDVEIRYRETAIRRVWALGMDRHRARALSVLQRWIQPGPRRLTAATLLALTIGGALWISEHPSGPLPGPAPGPSETPREHGLDDPIRGIEASPEATRSLRQVETLQVAWVSPNPELQELNRQLSRRLARGARFRVVRESDDADAMLTLAPGSSEAVPLGEAESARAELELVNRAGDVLWRADVALGPAEATAERLAEALEAAAGQ